MTEQDDGIEFEKLMKSNKLFAQAQRLVASLRKRLDKEEALCDYVASDEVSNLRYALHKLYDAIEAIELL